MAKTIVALYDEFSEAQEAVRELVDQGFRREDISLVANDASKEYSRRYGDQSRSTHRGGDKDRDYTTDDTASSAAAGAGIGGMLGLGAGIAVVAIPGIGPILALGPLATILAGAGAGAVAGGLIGGLTNMGVPEDEAGYYAEGVRRGGTLVTVSASDDMADRASDILNRYNPVNLDERSEHWRQNNWQGYDSKAEPYTAEEIARERERYGRSAGTSTRGTETGRGTEKRGRQDEERIPVVEEEVRVGKRQVQRGGVRIHSHVVERPVQEDVRLREEHVSVDRRPADRPVGDRDRDAAFKDRTVEFTETAEEAVVDKEARVKEEIAVRKETSEHTERIQDTVRKTEVDVEQTGAGTGRQDVDHLYSDFRRHFENNYGRKGQSFDRYEPAYQHGYSLGAQEASRDRDWNSIEPEARRRWEERHGGRGMWEEFKDAVRHGWATGAERETR